MLTIRLQCNCVSQPHQRGEIIVLLIFLSETEPLASGIFDYLDKPSIDSLEPNIGGLDGGSMVVLGGSGSEHVIHCCFDNHIVPANTRSGKSSKV